VVKKPIQKKSGGQLKGGVWETESEKKKRVVAAYLGAVQNKPEKGNLHIKVGEAGHHGESGGDVALDDDREPVGRGKTVEQGHPGR